MGLEQSVCIKRRRPRLIADWSRRFPSRRWLPCQQTLNLEVDVFIARVPSFETMKLIFLGPVVYGRNTKFLTELSYGDMIIIQHPTSYKLERRDFSSIGWRTKRVLWKWSSAIRLFPSGLSMVILWMSSSPFSKDFSSEIPFEYIKKTEEVIPEEEQQVRTL